MTRDGIIERVDTAWAAWTAALAGIPDSLSSEPGVCGYYSIKDLMGHIAFWDVQDLDRAHKLAKGELLPPNDWQAMNDQEYEERKHELLASQHAYMLDAHARLSADLRILDPIDETIVKPDIWEHYDEHRNEVLAWRIAQGI